MSGDPSRTSTTLEMTAETVPASVARLRRFAVDVCRTSCPDVDADTVALLASEVVTNALVHGTGEVCVRVVPLPDRLRVEVLDGSAALPRRREASGLDEGGRGVALVEALSVDWGVETTPSGKAVWFEVAAG